MNSVVSLKEQPFYMRPLEERVLIRRLGRPTPHLNIRQECTVGGYICVKQFDSGIYEKYPWMCGCEVQNALYCFPCLLLGGENLWSRSGLVSLFHLNTLANKHMESRKHISNVLELGALGIPSTDSQYIQEIERHNKQVDNNRYITSQIIDFLKTSRDLDTIDGMSINLEQIISHLDILMENAMLQNKLFQELSILVQDDLLQIILVVCQDAIIEELNRTKYVAVILDDTATVSSDLYLIVIFRYEIDGKLHERFWTLINIEEESAFDVLPYILHELKSVFDSYPNKIISLSFKGPSMIQIPADTLESKIREHFPRASHVLSYDDHLNTIIENAGLRNCSARKFLSCVSIFKSFFSNPRRLHLLENVASKRGIHSPPGGWDFGYQTITSIHQVQKEILECCLEFQSSLCNKTVQEARILQYFLEDNEFLFWLDFFHRIMVQVENLDIELLAGQVDTWKALQEFTSTLYEIQNQVSKNCEVFFQEGDQHKVNSLKGDCLEVCELIVAALRYRLQSKGHLEACRLFDTTCYMSYSENFPDELLSRTAELYSDINKLSLRAELDVFYEVTESEDMKECLTILQHLYFGNHEEAFPETVNLLRRIVTVPVKTSDLDCCPGLMKRIKTFIKNSSIRRHSAALIMLAAEKKLVSSIKDFNERVLEKLAKRETWMSEFSYQK